jgi:hypothetical protein
MDGERGLARSHRLQNLAEKFRDKRYRDGYVAAHTRGVLADQMRNFRGNRSQADYAAKIGKQKTVIGRLENPAYSGWSLRTMLEVARKEGVAVFVRFVDFPTFLKYSDDLSDGALQPRPYDGEAIEKLARDSERQAGESAIRALFSPPRASEDRPRALSAMESLAIDRPVAHPRVSFKAQSPSDMPANDGADSQQRSEPNTPSLLSASR